MMFSSIDVFPIEDSVKEVLKLHGLRTDKDFLAYSPDELARMTSLDIGELNKIGALIANPSVPRQETAFDCLERNLSKQFIPTLSSSIDEMLDGGFQTGRMYQFYGKSGVGKSQLCMQLACTVQIPRSVSGHEAPAIYIDTHSNFRSERLIEIGLATIERVNELPHNGPLDLSVAKLLDNVFIFSCQRFQDVSKVVLHELEWLVVEKQPKLIVLDDIASQFRHDLHTNEEFGHCKRKSLLQISQKLKSLACKYDLCVICVNQVSCDLSKQKVVPSLGILWNQTPYGHLNFQMAETHDDRRVRWIQGEKACYKPKKAFFQVAKGGIRDDEAGLNLFGAGEEPMVY